MVEDLLELVDDDILLGEVGNVNQSEDKDYVSRQDAENAKSSRVCDFVPFVFGTFLADWTSRPISLRADLGEVGLGWGRARRGRAGYWASFAVEGHWCPPLCTSASPAVKENRLPRSARNDMIGEQPWFSVVSSQLSVRDLFY
jgi:hypothetical protein